MRASEIIDTKWLSRRSRVMTMEGVSLVVSADDEDIFLKTTFDFDPQIVKGSEAQCNNELI